MRIKTRMKLEKRQPHVTALAESDTGRIHALFQVISDRAYALFQQRGCQDGHAMEDWMAAEAELFRNVPCEVAEKGNEVMVRIETPGFNERELDVRLDEDKVYIIGHGEKIVRSSTNVHALDERDTRDIFRMLALPAKVDPAFATANLNQGVLTIFAPKAAEKSKQAVA